MRQVMKRLAVLAIALAIFSAGCSADPCGGVTCADGSGDARTDGNGGGDARGDVVDPSSLEIVSLAITPDAPTLDVNPPAPATLVFHATGTRRDGTNSAVTVAYSLANNRVGTIAGDGTFTANGIAGGQVQVTATAPGPNGTMLTASTTLTVRVSRTVVGTGVTPDRIAAFGTAPSATDPAETPNVLYPLDQAMMPNNVAAPDIQWEHGAADDVFRVQISKPNARVTAYVLHSGASFGFDWRVDADAWRSVLESDPDAPAVIIVDRLDVAMNRVLSGSTLTVRFAHGSVFGVVYYWDLSDGVIQRIDAVSAVSNNLIPAPPSNGTSRCVACHAISQNGRYLSAELWDAGNRSTVFDLTADLSVDPAPTVFPTDRVSYLFSSFNPDATRLVTNMGNAFGMLDPLSGMSVAATGLPADHASHPAWSPDGNNIAFITNTNGGYAVDFTNGDLALLPRTGGDDFGAPVIVHAGQALAAQPETGNVDSHPSWSPDSQFLAFSHARHSRSDGGGGMDVSSALYLVRPTNGATPARLSAASGAEQGFWPTFSPFVTNESGGEHLYWLAFISRRDYGNAQVGTRGSTRRQIWVTAVNASGTADPSHVPYWLPGQDARVQNMAAQWAPLACRMTTATCSVSSECCSGICDPASHTCMPANTCRMAGQSCGGNDDCCSGLACVGNVCAAPPG